MADMILYLMVGAGIFAFAVAAGWLSRKRTNAPKLASDPVLIVLAAAFFLALVFADDKILYALVLLAGGYALGFITSQPPKSTTICQRNKQTGGLCIRNIHHYSKGGKQYLVERSMSGVIKAVMGRAQEIVLDTAMPHYTISITMEGEEIPGVILISSVEKQDAGDGKTRHIYHMANRMWERPEAFYYDLKSTDQAIAEAAELRAKLTRMDIEYQAARSNGMVDHFRRIITFNPTNPELLDRLKEITSEVKAKQKEAADGGNADD